MSHITHIIPTIHTTPMLIAAVFGLALAVLLIGMRAKRSAMGRALLYLGALMFAFVFLLMSHILVL